jgi:hypothetical protein
MRKFLLASTALVGAFTLVDRADAQQLTTDSPFTVRIDGFMNFRGGIVSESNTTSVSAAASNDVRRAAKSKAEVTGRGDNFRTDTEIHITATGKADNGLVYGMYVEIEADPALNALTTSTINVGGGTGVASGTGVPTSANNYIDEANIFLQGSWGRLEMGDQDGASDQLFFGAPYDYGPAYGQGSGADGDALFRWANGVGITNASSNINATPLYTWNVKALDSNDSTKITYLSPVISGFRAGISFAPDSGQNGFLAANGPNGRSNVTLSNVTPSPCTGPGAATCPALPATGAPGFANNQGTYGDFQHWIEVGAQWRGTVGDVGLGANVGYTHAEHKKGIFGAAVAPASNFITGASGTVAVPSFGSYNYVDVNSWHFGAQVSWMGLTFGGSYSNHGRSVLLTGPGLQRGQDAYAWVVGLQYAIGPWVVGYNYSYNLNAGSTSGSPGANRADINEWHSFGAKYILAPGLFLFAEYVHFNIYDEGTSVNNGDIGLLGTGIRF